VSGKCPTYKHFEYQVSGACSTYKHFCNFVKQSVWNVSQLPTYLYIIAQYLVCPNYQHIYIGLPRVCLNYKHICLAERLGCLPLNNIIILQNVLSVSITTMLLEHHLRRVSLINTSKSENWVSITGVPVTNLEWYVCSIVSGGRRTQFGGWISYLYVLCSRVCLTYQHSMVCSRGFLEGDSQSVMCSWAWSVAGCRENVSLTNIAWWVGS
jgi:hypothetical protein